MSSAIAYPDRTDQHFHQQFAKGRQDDQYGSRHERRDGRDEQRVGRLAAGARAALPEKERSALSLIEGAAMLHGDGLVLSTSFGIHSAAVLHLATRVVPDLPVVWVDTGYLPEETHRHAKALQEKLGLRLNVARADLSPAEMEAVHGKPWESRDAAALDLYDRVRKIEPMQRALAELGATGWLAGLRADQTDHRKTLPVVGEQWGRAKYLPILDWSSRDLHRYLVAHDLPLHPLFYEGYTTVGDWHTSRPLDGSDEHERDTRFLGLKQECGLHVA